MRKIQFLFLLWAVTALLQAMPTEVHYLSGLGLGNTVNWAFFCTGGHHSNQWDSIPVPSQWELQGFGEYTYGRWYKQSKDAQPSKEQGLYRTEFMAQESWRDKRVVLVFEGVMTDTEVKINGVTAGETHQGGFYEFSYDVTDKLTWGKMNRLEVTVSKHSQNSSINAAERKADWWLFGGIYRPVYLKIVPSVHLQYLALDCRADGSFALNLTTSPLQGAYQLRTELYEVATGKRIGRQQFSLTEGDQHHLKGAWKGINVWTPESPTLYELRCSLLDAKHRVVHAIGQRVGFRTIEFRPKDGLYLNDTRIILKGINRHSFHPDGGRTTNKQISIADVTLMKEMNMNAVRFHYPPDKHFLDACDSLGLFVMDELCGWQNGYDAQVAPKLLREMITRDVNHPSIILWSNGNEGGWSKSVDTLFAQLDPQQRHVVHPWADYNELDTHHYPAFLTGIARFTNGHKVFMPTEFMHGMYDQGHGAGLEDFWENYTSHPLFAGGFMWAFCDNAVRRSDKNGVLDSDGSNAPDGIVGPFREKEASYYTVRDIWAPIQFKKLFITSSFKGDFQITNAYLFTNLSACKLRYQLLCTPSPVRTASSQQVVETGWVALPALGPGDSGKLHIPITNRFFEADVLQLTAYHPDGKEMCTWSWPIHYASEYFARYQSISSFQEPAHVKEDSCVTLSTPAIQVVFSKKTGLLKDVTAYGKRLSFTNGPIPVGMKAQYVQGYSCQQGSEAVFVAKYLGAIDSIEWRLSADGVLSMATVMLNRASGGRGFDDAVTEKNISQLGFSFSYPEELVLGARWLGRGPYRVWKNRQRGMNFQIWEKEYNNTITGERADTLVYPEFKGYHANIYWLTLQSREHPFSVHSESDGLFVRLFTPEEPHHKLMETRMMPEFPTGDLSFLYEIPAIQSFKPIEEHGPKSQPGVVRIKSGDEGIKMKLHFDFRKF